MKTYIFILFCIAILFLSCAKEENSSGNIPEMPVLIDINYKTEPNFDKAFYYKSYYTGKNNIAAAGYIGVFVISLYDSSGAISVYPFELCCPNEAPQKNELKLVTNNWRLRCPKCGSEFSLMDNGKSVSGPYKGYLKKYRVRKNDVFYTIRN